MIDKLNTHYSFNNPASVYDEEALTALELAGRQGAKINEVITDQNALREETEAELTKHKEKVIPEVVNSVVKSHIENGTFDDQIEEHIENLENRVDNLLGNMKEGSTSMDAEVIDLRVSNDGYVFSNAGESIRHDFGALASKGLDEFIIKNNLVFEQKSWNGEPAINRLSVYPPVKLNEPVRITVPEDYSISKQIYEVDSNGEFILLGDTSWVDEATYPAGQYVCIGVKKKDDSVITPIDACVLRCEVCSWNDNTFLSTIGHYTMKAADETHPSIYLGYVGQKTMATFDPIYSECDIEVTCNDNTRLSLILWEGANIGEVGVIRTYEKNTSKVIIPRNTYTTLHFKDIDGGVVTMDNIKNVEFKKLVPSEIYNSFECKDYTGSYVNTRMTALYQTYDNTFKLEAGEGYQLAVVRYHLDGEEYALENNSGWVKSYTVPANKPVTITFRKEDDSIITVEDLTNLEFVTPIWEDAVYKVSQGSIELSNILSTVHHASWGGNGVGYVENYTRMVSNITTLDTPLTLESIHPDVYISAQGFNDDNKLISDTGWSKEIVLPAGIRTALYIKQEGSSYMDLDALNYIKCVDNSAHVVSVGMNDNVKAIAHRGFSLYAPENTLIAYQKAVDNGYKYAECDVSFTSDGVAVLLHDSTINRTSNGSGNISDLTLEEVRQYDFGSWFSSDYAGTTIPTFEEFIVFCRNKGLHPYIELKAGATEEEVKSVVDTVIANGMKRKITYISFDYTLISYVHQYDPTARIGWVVNSCDNSTTEKINALRSDNDVVCFLNHSAVNDNTVTACISADIEMECWTVNTEDRMKELDPYVTGVASDGLHFGSVVGGV